MRLTALLKGLCVGHHEDSCIKMFTISKEKGISIDELRYEKVKQKEQKIKTNVHVQQ